MYYEDLIRMKLLSKRGISLENVPEKLPNFYKRLEAMGWTYFSLKACHKNEHWVREFYANLSIVKTSNPIMRIREKSFRG